MSRQSKNMKDIEKFYNKTENTEKEIEEKLRINKTQFISQLNSEENRIERLRIEILYEIIDSENIYIHDLETIVKVYTFSFLSIFSTNYLTSLALFKSFKKHSHFK